MAIVLALFLTPNKNLDKKRPRRKDRAFWSANNTQAAERIFSMKTCLVEITQKLFQFWKSFCGKIFRVSASSSLQTVAGKI
jgi:hypothetical protein